MSADAEDPKLRVYNIEVEKLKTAEGKTRWNARLTTPEHGTEITTGSEVQRAILRLTSIMQRVGYPPGVVNVIERKRQPEPKGQ